MKFASWTPRSVGRGVAVNAANAKSAFERCFPRTAGARASPRRPGTSAVDVGGPPAEASMSAELRRRRRRRFKRRRPATRSRGRRGAGARSAGHGPDAQGPPPPAHAGLPIIGDELYGVPAGIVAAYRDEEDARGRDHPDGDGDPGDPGDTSRASRTSSRGVRAASEAARRRRVWGLASAVRERRRRAFGDGDGDGDGDPGDPGDGDSSSSLLRLASDWSARGRTALHAWNLRTRHPSTSAPLRLATDPPEDFAALAEALGLNVEGVLMGEDAEEWAARAGGGGGGGGRR